VLRPACVEERIDRVGPISSSRRSYRGMQVLGTVDARGPLHAATMLAKPSQRCLQTCAESPRRRAWHCDAALRAARIPRQAAYDLLSTAKRRMMRPRQMLDGTPRSQTILRPPVSIHYLGIAHTREDEGDVEFSPAATAGGCRNACSCAESSP